MQIILIFDNAHVNGGQNKVAIDSALGLRARGYDVTVFAAVGPADPRLTAAGVEVICLGQHDVHTSPNKLAFVAQYLWNGAAARALEDILRRCDPARTIVHVHGWAKALSPSIGPAVARSGLAAVQTLHEYFLVCPNGGLYDFQAEAACGRTPMSGACLTAHCDAQSYPRKVLRAARHLTLALPAGLNELRHVIVLSNLQAEVVQPHLPKRSIVHRVHNPVVIPNLGPKPDDAVLEDALFVGRLSAEKGAAVFAEAARRAGMRAVFIGSGPAEQSLRSRFPEAAYLGWKDPAEVHARMRGARALVFPSVWHETHGLTAYEALGLGTAVIVSDACVTREAVIEGETGFWFRSGDPDSLADKLSAIADDGVARRMGRAAYDRYWAAPFTLERHLDETLATYTAVLNAEAGKLARRGPVPGPSAKPAFHELT